MRDDMRFAHAAARVRVLELRLLDRGRLDRLVEATGVAEVLRLLGETEYGPAVAELAEDDDYEQILTAELQRVFALVESFAPEPRLLEAWAARHAFHNLKALLKAALRGEAVEESSLSPLATVDRDVLAELVKRAVGTVDGPSEATVAVSSPAVPVGPPQVRIGGTVDEPVAGPPLEGYLRRAASRAVADYRAGGGPEGIDQAVDGVYQEYLLALTGLPGAEFLRGWVERWTDLVNLRTALRFALAGRSASDLRRGLLPGGTLTPDRLIDVFSGTAETQARLEGLAALAGRTPYAGVVGEGLRRFAAEGLLAGFERAADLHLLAYLREAKRFSTGLAPVWAYLMAKEQEVRLLRLILVGKSAGLSPDELRERMSDVYA